MRYFFPARLVYLQASSENLDSLESSHARKDETAELRKLGAEISSLEQLEKAAQKITELDKKKESALSRTKLLEGNGSLSAPARKLLKERADAVSNLRGEDKETLQKLEKAITELEDALRTQTERLTDSATWNSKLRELTTVANGAKIFEKVNLTLDSKTGIKVQVVKGQLTGGVKIEDLSTDQKKQFATALESALKTQEKTTEGSAAVAGLVKKLMGNPEVPTSWKQWLADPSNPKWEGGTKSQAEVAFWIQENWPPLAIQAGQYKEYLNKINATPKGAAKGAEAGLPTMDQFRQFSRTERNEALKKCSNVLTGIDDSLARRAAESRITDDASSKKVGEANKTEIDKKSAEEEALAKKTAAGLQKFAEKFKVAEARTARENEIKKRPDLGSLQDQLAKRRGAHQSGEKSGTGMLNKIKKLFTKKEVTTNNPSQGNSTKEKPMTDAEEIKESEPPEAIQAREQVTEELLGKEVVAAEFQRSIGIQSATKEDLKKLGNAFLNAKQIDAKAIQNALALDLELGKILERQSAPGDYSEAPKAT